MMSNAQLVDHLAQLRVTQTEAARLLSVNVRTVRRWLEDPSEIPGPAEHALRAWLRLHRLGLAWRPDGLPLGESDVEEMANQIALYRQHAINLDAALQRVQSRGGPAAPWQVDLAAKVATLGPMRVGFYRLPNGGFSPSTYRRSDSGPDLERDALLLEDAYACIAISISEQDNHMGRGHLEVVPDSQPATPTNAVLVAQRLLCTPVFHIDTNMINARGKLEAMNQLEKWKSDGVILINMSGVSFKEARAGANYLRTKKTYEQIFTTTDSSISKSDTMYKRIESVLFPRGTKSQSDENDIKVVYEAAYYRAILITNEGASRRQPGGILGNRDALRDLVQIMRDVEAVSFIRKKIAERDAYIRSLVAETCGLLPDWIGKD